MIYIFTNTIYLLLHAGMSPSKGPARPSPQKAKSSSAAAAHRDRPNLVTESYQDKESDSSDSPEEENTGQVNTFFKNHNKKII